MTYQNIPPPVGGIRQPVPIYQTESLSSPGGSSRTDPRNSRETKSQNGQQQSGDNQTEGKGQEGGGESLQGDESTPVPGAAVLPAPIVPNYSSMTPEEQAQHRANFRTRFGILRNAWPNYHIPDVPDDVPLEQVHAQYDIYVRHIHISQDVDQYKVYLVIMWLLIELFCTKIGLNIGGYTVAQMRSMNKYERLLIELGENSYKSSVAAGGVGAQSSWPVEVRIFFMALVNAVTFIIIKMLAGYIGEGMATTIVDGLSSYLSGAPPQPGQVLFGGPQGSAPDGRPQPQGPLPGGQPVPEMSGPFGGLDVTSLIANLGSMFIRGQGPGAAAAPPAQPSPSPSVIPQGPTTPRFRPAYEE